MLDKAFEKNNSSSNLLFHRGILRFALGSKYFFFFDKIYIFKLGGVNEAIIDIEKAIEKSETNIAKYYYSRGLCYAVGKCYKQAIYDLSITI